MKGQEREVRFLGMGQRRPFPLARGSGSAVSPPADSGAEPRPPSIYFHFIDDRRLFLAFHKLLRWLATQCRIA